MVPSYPYIQVTQGEAPYIYIYIDSENEVENDIRKLELEIRNLVAYEVAKEVATRLAPPGVADEVAKVANSIFEKKIL